MARDVMAAFEYAGYKDLVDQVRCFRDENDETVVTFSPYGAVEGEVKVSGCEVEVEKLSICGSGM